MKNSLTQTPWLATLLVLVSALGGIALLADFFEFRKATQSSYTTPWYSTSWLEQPYTNARLALLPHKEYWTMNAIKSERWLVREVVVGDTTFWTTLQRIPVETA